MKNKNSVWLLFPLLLASVSCWSSHNQKNTEVPVDCPLKKQGVNARGMKPFEDVKKYIDFLERKDRNGWQKPEAVISSIGLKGSEILADIGAGSGYFTFRFSKELPRGKVVAIDVEPGMIRYIHHKAKTSRIKNIEVVIASYDDPRVPENVDVVFMCDVLHHVKKRGEWLSKLYTEMKKSSKLILIEFKEGNIPEGPPASIKITSKEMLSLMAGAGFKLIKQHSRLLACQYYYG